MAEFVLLLPLQNGGAAAAIDNEIPSSPICLSFLSAKKFGRRFVKVR